LPGPFSNTIHDDDNIGIDAIGFEGVSPDSAYDYARKGVNGEKHGCLRAVNRKRRSLWQRLSVPQLKDPAALSFKEELLGM